MPEAKTSTRSRDNELTVGVDVGGTKIKTALVDRRGEIFHAERRSTEAARGADHVIRDIVEAVRKLLDGAPGRVTSMGLGIAGQIDQTNGIVVESPNLEWRNVELKAPLQDALGLDVFVTNDLSAAAWGEHRFGAGRGETDLICIFVGTGLGAGVITAGRLLEGSNGSASELGHVPIVCNGRECSCGNRGCLEAYVGGWAIAARAREAAQQEPGEAKTLLALAGDADSITAKHVTDAFHRKDPLARRLVEETRDYLSAAVVGMVNTFNPSLIIFGGGVVDGLPELTETVDEVVRARAFTAFTQTFRVTFAELGNNAGVAGAAALGRDRAATSR